MTKDLPGAFKFETIEKTDKIKAAEETLKLRLLELEISRKAVVEANKRLDALIIASLNCKSLKPHEGELVNVVDFNNRIYFYSNGSFHALVPPEKVSIENLP